MEPTQLIDALKFVWDYLSADLFAWVLELLRTLIQS